MNKNKILSAEGKVKVTRQNVTGGADKRQEFCLTNSVIQIILENRTKIVSAFKQNRLRIQLFQKLKQHDVMRYCIMV
jgi:uncharacterized protein YegJ (DUF2314 family)